jgi:hypothetical protein
MVVIWVASKTGPFPRIIYCKAGDGLGKDIDDRYYGWGAQFIDPLIHRRLHGYFESEGFESDHITKISGEGHQPSAGLEVEKHAASYQFRHAPSFHLCPLIVISSLRF